MSSRPRTSAALQRLRFDAGSLSLNLVATVGRRGAGEGRQVERLLDERALERWCAGVGLELRRGVDRAGLLKELREIREASWAVLGAHLHGGHVAPDVVERLGRWANAPIPLPYFEDGPGIIVRRPALSEAAVHASVVQDLLAILASDHVRGRLRECASEDCRMVYLAAPGGRERRWCSMSQCGNRAKAAAHRAKEQAEGSRAEFSQ